jgi:hypothetical protein
MPTPRPRYDQLLAVLSGTSGRRSRSRPASGRAKQQEDDPVDGSCRGRRRASPTTTHRRGRLPETGWCGLAIARLTPVIGHASSRRASRWRTDLYPRQSDSPEIRVWGRHRSVPQPEPARGRCCSDGPPARARRADALSSCVTASSEIRLRRGSASTGYYSFPAVERAFGSTDDFRPKLRYNVNATAPRNGQHGATAVAVSRTSLTEIHGVGPVLAAKILDHQYSAPTGAALSTYARR